MKDEPKLDGPPLLNATVVAEEHYDRRDGGSAAVGRDIDVDQILAAVIKSGRDVTLSSFERTARNVTEADDDLLELSLCNGESITCIGEYDIQVVRGAVTVYGALLQHPTVPQRVYAPSTHALPQIVARRDDTTIRLAHVKSNLRKLEKLSPLFRNIWAAKGSDSAKHTFTLLGTAADDELQRAVSPLETDQRAQAILLRLAAEAETRAMRVMAIGAKSSGKSTFNRLLCNTLLSTPSVQRLLLLELDPGQPEFGPPGQLSLVEVTAHILGPPFTHVAGRRSSRYRLLRSHTIAATSFRDDPAHYLACAQDLIQHANIQCPLIVNSCGWISGLGANVLVDLTSIANITDMVVMEPAEDGLVNAMQAGSQDLVCHRMARRNAKSSQRTPAESRAMQTMAYFHRRRNAPGNELKWSGKAVSAFRPWVVSYDGPHAGLYAIHSYGQPPNPKFLAEILNGSLVAVVAIAQHHMHEAFSMKSYAQQHQNPDLTHSIKTSSEPLSAETLVASTHEGLPYVQANGQGISCPLNPRYSECLGLALVRAIDPERKEIQLVTPLPESEIAALADRKVVLVRGGFDAPEWAYVEDMYSASDSSLTTAADKPWVSKKEPVGIEGAVWRLRHPPMAAAVATK